MSQQYFQTVKADSGGIAPQWVCIEKAMPKHKSVDSYRPSPSISEFSLKLMDDTLFHYRSGFLLSCHSNIPEQVYLKQ